MWLPWWCLTRRSALPQPEYTFRLSFTDVAARRFVGDGQSFDGQHRQDLTWGGRWTVFEDSLHLIGRVETGESSSEWRGRSVIWEEDVMILNINAGDGHLFVVRCLPAEGS